MKPSESHLEEAVRLLSRLISIPSVSGEEREAADFWASVVGSSGFDCRRAGNNVWAVDPFFDSRRPTLCSTPTSTR